VRKLQAAIRDFAFSGFDFLRTMKNLEYIAQGWPDFFACGPNFENIFHRGPQVFNFWAL